MLDVVATHSLLTVTFLGVHSPAHCLMPLTQGWFFPVWDQVLEEPVYTEFISAALHPEKFGSVFPISGHQALLGFLELRVLYPVWQGGTKLEYEPKLTFHHLWWLFAVPFADHWPDSASAFASRYHWAIFLALEHPPGSPQCCFSSQVEAIFYAQEILSPSLDTQVE